MPGKKKLVTGDNQGSLCEWVKLTGDGGRGTSEWNEWAMEIRKWEKRGQVEKQAFWKQRTGGESLDCW